MVPTPFIPRVGSILGKQWGKKSFKILFALNFISRSKDDPGAPFGSNFFQFNVVVLKTFWRCRLENRGCGAEYHRTKFKI